MLLLGGATRKWDDFKRRGKFYLGEGGIVVPDFDTAQAREMKEWFATSNELSDVELPDGAGLSPRVFVCERVCARAGESSEDRGARGSEEPC